MSAISVFDDAFLYIDDGKIVEWGTNILENILRIQQTDSMVEMIDADGGLVFPCWVDAHTHIVYASSREAEFADRIRGLSYEEIASRGGGILNSVQKLRQASEEELTEAAMDRLDEMVHSGTGAVEIKSGYGLDLESELKILRVIRSLKEHTLVTMRATFLGAHAIPAEFKKDKPAYLRLLTEKMIPAIAEEKLADYCDIFIENGYFTSDDAAGLFDVAAKHGLIPKVHAEQLSHSGGIAAGVSAGAISVDHLEFANADDIQRLAKSETIPVLLPGAQFFLGLKNPPAREMINAGLPVAISSDFNPGTCPSGNMLQMVSLACIMYRMTPEESILAATTNAAAAIGLSKELGSIAVGKIANVFITKPVPSYSFIPYSFGSNFIRTVILRGEIQVESLC